MILTRFQATSFMKIGWGVWKASACEESLQLKLSTLKSTNLSYKMSGQMQTHVFRQSVTYMCLYIHIYTHTRTDIHTYNRITCLKSVTVQLVMNQSCTAIMSFTPPLLFAISARNSDVLSS